MIEDGDAVPESSKIEDIQADVKKSGAIAFMISVDTPDATERVNITARESQIEKIDALAKQAGLTRSAYMVRSAIGEEKKSARAHARSARARWQTRGTKKEGHHDPLFWCRIAAPVAQAQSVVVDFPAALVDPALLFLNAQQQAVLPLADLAHGLFGCELLAVALFLDLAYLAQIGPRHQQCAAERRRRVRGSARRAGAHAARRSRSPTGATGRLALRRGTNRNMLHRLWTFMNRNSGRRKSRYHQSRVDLLSGFTGAQGLQIDHGRLDVFGAKPVRHGQDVDAAAQLHGGKRMSTIYQAK
jgi:hypothetical protein